MKLDQDYVLGVSTVKEILIQHILNRTGSEPIVCFINVSDSWLIKID